MEDEKIKQARDILEEEAIDCWLVIDKESEVLSDPIMDFVVGTGVTWLSFFLFFRDGETHAIVGNLDLEKFERLRRFDHCTGYKASPRQELIDLLNRKKPNHIAIDFSTDSPPADGLTHGRFLELQALLAGTPHLERLVSAEAIIAKLRGRKSAEEVTRIEEAVAVTLEIYDRVSAYARPGQSEKQLAEFISTERRKLGLPPAWEEDHCPSVFTGPQTTGAHSGPTDNTLRRGHVFNIDFGVKVKQYCSDLQRTWYILKEGEDRPPAEVLRGFSTIRTSIEMAFAAMKPGARGIDIDRIAREHIVSQGYDEYPHALGHQVGRSAHDGGGLLGPAWERYGNLPRIPLEEGNVFTIEPRLYLEDHGVVTVEEMVLITRDGARWLSRPQKEVFLIQ